MDRQHATTVTAPAGEAHAKGTGGEPRTVPEAGRLLVAALRANVVLSAACGLALLVGGHVLAEPFGVNGWLLTALGAGLAVFAGDIAWLLARPRQLERGAGFVSAADVAWVAGAVALLAFAPSALAPAGRWALLAATVAVAAVAAGQVAGLRLARTAS